MLHAGPDELCFVQRWRAVSQEYVARRPIVDRAFSDRRDAAKLRVFLLTSEASMGKAIIVGASSGIGWELAIQLADAGYQLGLMARREDRLNELIEQLPGEHWVQCSDVTECEHAQAQLQGLIERMGGVDMVVLNSGAVSYTHLRAHET